MRKLFFIAPLLLLLSSCSKDAATGRIAIYKLSAYTMVAGKCQVDGATAQIEQLALLDDRDIISYDANNYEYTLTSAAAVKLSALPARTALALTIDQKPVFYFINMPSILSSSCWESITMDAFYSGNKMRLRLGYPGITVGTVIDDQRNNQRILAILRAQGKL
jgi:hypothetical protein